MKHRHKWKRLTVMEREYTFPLLIDACRECSVLRVTYFIGENTTYRKYINEKGEVLLGGKYRLVRPK